MYTGKMLSRINFFFTLSQNIFKAEVLKFSRYPTLFEWPISSSKNLATTPHPMFTLHSLLLYMLYRWLREIRTVVDHSMSFPLFAKLWSWIMEWMMFHRVEKNFDFFPERNLKFLLTIWRRKKRHFVWFILNIEK